MKLVVFDCDGTIADSQHMICAAMEGAFANFDLGAPNRLDIIGVVGLSLEEAVSRLLPEPNPEPGFVDRVADGYRQAFSVLRRDPAHTEPLFEGAREALAALSARDDIVLGVATGKSRRGLDRLLERENLADYFVTLQTADDHPSKPHPSMLATAMSEVGARARDTVMIGDTTFDIDMAVAANVGAIGVTWGYHPGCELSAAGAHAMIDSFDALTNAIDGVFSVRAEAVV